MILSRISVSVSSRPSRREPAASGPVRSSSASSSVRASVAFSVEPSHSPSAILPPVGGDCQHDDVDALGDLQAVEHHHREADAASRRDISSPSAVRVRR